MKILDNRQDIVELKSLGHIPDRLLYLLRLIHEIESCDLSPPRSRQQKSAEHSDGGGLAGTIWAQKSEDFSLLYLKMDMVHSDKVSEGFY